MSRGRLAIGLIALSLVAGGLAFGLSKLRSAPSAGRFVYAARQGVFERELSTGTDRKLGSLPSGVEVAMPSPDGRRVAYALGQGDVWIAGFDDDERYQVSERFTIPLGWTPDGRLIVGELLSDRDLVAVDPDGGREVLLTGGYASGAAPIWLDAKRFAIARNESSFIVVDGRTVSFTHGGKPLAASADGAELLFADEGGVFVAKVGRGDLTDERRIFRDDAAFGASSPRGFAAIATDDAVFVFEGGTRTKRVVDRPVDWVGWANTGAVLLYAHDGAAYALDLTDDEPSATRLTRTGADVFRVLPFAVLP